MLPAGTPVRVTVAEQLSVAVAVPSMPSATVTAHATAEAPVFTVRFAGALKTGFSWSSTVTVCVAVFVLPCASVAVQVIVVVPTGNNAANNAASLRTPTSVTPGQVSEAVVPSDAIVAPQAP